MIQQVSAYRVGEQVFPTIQEAQKSELIDLMTEGNSPTEKESFAAQWMVEHTDEVVAILTCHPKTKAPRKPRSDIGKKRAAKTSQPPAL